MPSQIKVDEIKNVAGQYKIKTDTLEGQSTTNNMTINSGNITVKGEGTATTNLQQGLAKAWGAVTDAAAISDSFNLTTGTDHATGDFSYPLINPYASVNHVMAASSSSAGAGRMITSNTARKTTGIIALELETHSGATEDIAQEIIGNGDLA